MKSDENKQPVVAGSMPRGYRNNNPLNIRLCTGVNWQGAVPKQEQKDKEFVQFKTMAYGFRAAFCIFRTYITSHHRNTITDIIKRWAPPSENNTNAYIRHVAELTGLHTDYPLHWENPGQMKRLARAMATIENGFFPDAFERYIDDGWTMFIN